MEQQARINKVIVFLGFFSLGAGLAMMLFFLGKYATQEEGMGSENFYYAMYSLVVGLAIFGIMEIILHVLSKMEIQRMNSADSLRELVEEQLSQITKKDEEKHLE